MTRYTARLKCQSTDTVAKISAGEGHTPLTTAAYYGNVAVAKLLLNKGADPNAPDKRNTHPLVIAAGHHGHLEIVKALVEKGVKVHGRIGTEALEMALGCRRFDVAEFLMEKGAKPSYLRAIQRFYQN